MGALKLLCQKRDSNDECATFGLVQATPDFDGRAYPSFAQAEVGIESGVKRKFTRDRHKESFRDV